jgi:rhamnose transport system ATP-binding protein
MTSETLPLPTTPAEPMPGSFVRLVDAVRVFGSTRALKGVTLDVAVRGKIHALVGENGAGKSTCLGLVSGRVAPTSGHVLADGVELEHGSPRASKAAGIHTIYQELTIIPALTPEANLFLGQNIASSGWLNERAMRKAYVEMATSLGIKPVKTRQSGTLSVADQQMLEIMRALVSTAQAILLDEPTASLAQSERDSLFATLHRLQQQGMALTLVSHNLDEVLTHSDIVTVFRDGSVVAQRPTSEWNKRDLVSAMLGSSDRGAAIAAGRHRPHRTAADTEDAPTMRVQGLSSPGILQDISFDLHHGEVLGIAGLVGSGRTSLLRALAGLDPAATAELEIDGKTVHLPRSVREARRRGIALLPEDRKDQGLVAQRTAADNVMLGEWGSLSRLSMVRERQLRRVAGDAAESVGFDRRRIGEPAAQFSGGNQQKLMIARWVHADHPILLADEPTRGVDVGAKAEILVKLEQIVGEGRSMVIVSSELEEVVGLSDRVLVLSEGRTVTLLDATVEEITVERILRLIFDAIAEPATARN